MKVDKEQFHKAQKFVIEKMEKAHNSKNQKEEFEKAIVEIEDEIRNSENWDYKRALLFLTSEIADEFNEENQSQ